MANLQKKLQEKQTFLAENRSLSEKSKKVDAKYLASITLTKQDLFNLTSPY